MPTWHYADSQENAIKSKQEVDKPYGCDDGRLRQQHSSVKAGVGDNEVGVIIMAVLFFV